MLREMHYTWQQVADVLMVSRSTLWRRLTAQKKILVYFVFTRLFFPENERVNTTGYGLFYTMYFSTANLNSIKPFLHILICLGNITPIFLGNLNLTESIIIFSHSFYDHVNIT